MTAPLGLGDIIPGVTLGDMFAYPKTEEFPSLNMTQHNTPSPRTAIQHIRNAAKKKETVDINGWESNNNQLIQFVAKKGFASKGGGVSASFLLDDLKKYVKAHPGKGTMSDQLSAYLIDSAGLTGRRNIDFFQVNAYHK
jgi:hypothetical protein